MTLKTYTRVGDFSADEAAAKTGRSTQDSAQLDAELDAVKVVTDDAKRLFGVLLRADEKLLDNILQGHEFSAAAISAIEAGINTVASAGPVLLSTKTAGPSGVVEFDETLIDGTYDRYRIEYQQVATATGDRFDLELFANSAWQLGNVYRLNSFSSQPPPAITGSVDGHQSLQVGVSGWIDMLANYDPVNDMAASLESHCVYAAGPSGSTVALDVLVGLQVSAPVRGMRVVSGIAGAFIGGTFKLYGLP